MFVEITILAGSVTVGYQVCLMFDCLRRSMRNSAPFSRAYLHTAVVAACGAALMTVLTLRIAERLAQ